LNNFKYVTVIHYAGSFAMGEPNHQLTPKYSFVFVRNTNDLEKPIYPRTIAHEFMHSLGAYDKYETISARACKLGPDGREYDGYDIMCHRAVIVGDPGFYTQPNLDELKITDPTAQEIGWLSSNILLLGSPSFGVIFFKGSANLISWSNAVCPQSNLKCVTIGLRSHDPFQGNQQVGWVGVASGSSRSFYWDAKKVCSTADDLAQAQSSNCFNVPNSSYLIEISDSVRSRVSPVFSIR